MRIAQITDSHLCLPEPQGTSRQDDLAQVVAAVNRLDPPALVAVHTGDIVHTGSDAEYRAARDILSRLEMPLWVIPGNKDDRQRLAAHFGDCLGTARGHDRLDYTRDLDGIRLVMLDTVREGASLGSFGASACGWLAETLARPSVSPTIIFMHHPPFAIHGPREPWQFSNREDLARLEPVIADAPGVRAIVCGHGHRSQQASFAGKPAFMTTAVARDLKWPRTPEVNGAPASFAVIDHDGDAVSVTPVAVA